MPYKDQTRPEQQLINMRYHLKARYGISVEDFNALLKAQNNVCAICKRPEKDQYKRRLSVDHDHTTDDIRGLLCHACNTAIGKFEDNPEWLEAAAAYLRSFEETK